MYPFYLLLNNISFILIKNTLLDMTINNPIFIFAVITVIWFVPGILVRTYNKKKQSKRKREAQDDAISKLYPTEKDRVD